MDGIGAYKKTMGAKDGGSKDAAKKTSAENLDFSAENDWLSKIARFDNNGSAEPDLAEKEKALPEYPPFVKVPEALKKHERLARFLAMIGEEEAEKILRELKGPETVILKKEVETLRGLGSKDGRFYGMTKEESQAIYEEFKKVLSKKTESPSPLSFLEEFAPEQVAMLLHKESPQTCAAVLARMPPKLAAGALSFIEKEKKQDIVFRIARLKPVAPEIIMTIAANLRERARELGHESSAAQLDGISALAEILKNADVSFGDKIIAELALEDPLLGQNLKERLYTLDDVCRAEDKPIAEKLAEMSEKEIALLLRGRPDNFKEKIMANVSSGRGSLIREEDELMGAVLKSDAAAALKDFLQWFRDKREKGELLFVDDEVLI